MTKPAFLFPGQGAQTVGMGKVLVESAPAARLVFERASAILGYDLLAICLAHNQENRQNVQKRKTVSHGVSKSDSFQ